MTAKKPRRLPITERALVQRLRRHLSKDNERLLTNRRPERFGPAFVGKYYILDGRNIMTDHNVDIVKMAKELGAIRPWEQLIEEEED
jgi:hypothetical protein